ncbi:hypothetical protein BDZ45DRAFT_43131 [Acephala macrosclerotiorum]|nr:hypothetical protein BDZ45DRAFT_43131 [Acephala macrosclerotiorum]
MNSASSTANSIPNNPNAFQSGIYHMVFPHCTVKTLKFASPASSSSLESIHCCASNGVQRSPSSRRTRSPASRTRSIRVKHMLLKSPTLRSMEAGSPAEDFGKFPTRTIVAGEACSTFSRPGSAASSACSSLRIEALLAWKICGGWLGHRSLVC